MLICMCSMLWISMEFECLVMGRVLVVGRSCVERCVRGVAGWWSMLVYDLFCMRTLFICLFWCVLYGGVCSLWYHLIFVGSLVVCRVCCEFGWGWCCSFLWVCFLLYCRFGFRCGSVLFWVLWFLGGVHLCVFSMLFFLGLLVLLWFFWWVFGSRWFMGGLGWWWCCGWEISCGGYFGCRLWRWRIFLWFLLRLYSVVLTFCGWWFCLLCIHRVGVVILRFCVRYRM